MVTAQDVKAARERLGESQTAFAKRFGVDQSTIHRWETDGVPDRGVTARAVAFILNELGCPPAATNTEAAGCAC